MAAALLRAPAAAAAAAARARQARLLCAPRPHPWSPAQLQRENTVAAAASGHSAAGGAAAAAAAAVSASPHGGAQQQQPPQERQALPTTAYGQVISAEANFVRVHVSELGADATSSNGGSSSSPPPPPPRAQLLCTVRALLKKINQRVLVGDRVRLHAIDWDAGRGVVESVAPRSSELADPAVANVDHVLLLFGLTQPPFEPAQVSRFLVSVGASGLPVTLALNKADLLPAAAVEARLAQVASWGHAAIAVSCESGQGLQQLAQRLARRVSVVAGPSGAGKSSLINALRLGRHKPDAAGATAAGWAPGSGGGAHQALSLPPQQLRDHVGPSSGGSASASSSSAGSAGSAGSFLAVGDVSKIGRGKHTTRTVTLIELPCGGLMADTPGFNQPTLDRVSSMQLAGLFPEFVAAMDAAGGCRFSDCLHLAEPGCAVTAAELERHDHYLRLLAEITAREEYDVRVMQAAKAQREGSLKLMSGRGGSGPRYQARLNTRKHRATSRRRAKQSLMDEVGAAAAGGGAGDELLHGEAGLD